MLLDQTLCFLRVFMFIEVHDRDISSLRRKSDRHRATDTAIAAGYERDLVLQFSTSPVFFVFRFGARLHFMLAAGLSSLMLRRLEFLFFGHAKKIRIWSAAQMF